MALVVTGSRRWTNRGLVYDVLDLYLYDDSDLIIRTAGTRGVCSIAEDWAAFSGVACFSVSPGMEHFCNEMAVNREYDMWDPASEGIVFWNGKSSWLEVTINMALQMKKSLVIIKCKQGETEFEVLTDDFKLEIE